MPAQSQAQPCTCRGNGVEFECQSVTGSLAHPGVRITGHVAHGKRVTLRLTHEQLCEAIAQIANEMQARREALELEGGK